MFCLGICRTDSSLDSPKYYFVKKILIIYCKVKKEVTKLKYRFFLNIYPYEHIIYINI